MNVHSVFLIHRCFNDVLQTGQLTDSTTIVTGNELIVI